MTAIRGSSVSGAVGFNPAGPRAFPTLATLKTSLALTEAQTASLTPIVDAANKDIQAAVTAGDFQKVGSLRTASADAVRQQLTAAQQAAFNTLMTPPDGGGRGRGAPPTPLSAEDAQAQAKRYGEIFGVFMKHRKSIARVTFWGVRDTDSWRRNMHPLIFDEAYGRKPAYDAVLAAAKNAAP